jgi:hypothetical protein
MKNWISINARYHLFGEAMRLIDEFLGGHSAVLLQLSLQDIAIAKSCLRYATKAQKISAGV